MIVTVHVIDDELGIEDECQSDIKPEVALSLRALALAANEPIAEFCVDVLQIGLLHVALKRASKLLESIG
jgi:hypothetical protein